jgi:hypothetical protein
VLILPACTVTAVLFAISRRKGVARYHSYPYFKMLCLICILVYLAPSLTSNPGIA